jgi:hypothetical protein
MSKMRQILSSLMAKAGDDAYSLQTKSGVPQPTTQRFLAGKHGEPRSSTVRKWASVYGVTESQLRGDVPIDGIADSAKTVEDYRARLNKEQQRILDLVERMDEETGALFMKLFEKLIPDRRKKQSKEGPRARAIGYGAGESIRRGDLFVDDELLRRRKDDGNTV